MNYHLMIDEKFTEDFIADAEKHAPGNNVYLVSLYTKTPKFAKSPLITHVKSVKKYWFSHIAPTLKKDDKVFIHWLDRRVYDIVLSIPPEINVGIFSWMGDVIATPTYLFDKDILKPTSYAFFKRYKKRRFEKDARHGGIYNFLLFGRHVLRELNAPREWQKKKKVMQRLNLFFHWNEFDYQWVKEYYPGFDAQFVYFVYDVGLNAEADADAHTKNADAPLTIWLGNSATISNNHFEALDDLSHLKDENIEIICPLSYGEKTNSVYTKQLIEKGQRIFGSKFTPLLTYLDRDAYYALFHKVDLVVMNHIRSQAAGNVFMFLKFGKILFMDEKSTLYQFLRSKNTANLYPINNISDLSFNNLKEMIAQRADNEDFENILNMDKKAENLKAYLR